ncbi:MAG: tRNA 2-thiouridine(34) synthase MnmA [Rickettsiales bacterium]|nr:tRNA 2-thiouridine(34) synthase MnmA [Rickettsiales bacterium]
MSHSLNSLGFAKPPSQTRVVVAMSGGVDSSVVAGMLHHEGYEVIGITLQLYDHGAIIGKKGACCAGQDIHDARRVAESLGIPHYVLNYEDRFRDAVMDDFADSYLAGETPIPCVKCNQSVKFKDLLSTARELGADCMATGHYVQRVAGNAGAELHQAAEIQKDQSYFLFATTREQLEFLRFPLGGQPKEVTRHMAVKMGLQVHDKPDSQDICFVPNGNYASVIEKLRPGAADPGDIVHVDGYVVGQHQGVIHYTVGQRKGLGVAHDEALYVVRLEPTTRRVYVGPKAALEKTCFLIRDINWLEGMSMPELREEIHIKWRSSQPLKAASVQKLDSSRALVRLYEPQAAISPGQACVFYHGTRVLGGGWIMAMPPEEMAAYLAESVQTSGSNSMTPSSL